MIFAVDFDGTLVKNKYPEIKNPNTYLIEFCKNRQLKYNDIIILWTCRTGKYLEDALIYLKDNFNFIPDYVNENAPYDKTMYPIESRKISADYYIDDKAINVNNNIDDFLKEMEMEIGVEAVNKNNLKVDKEEIIQKLCKAICPVIQPYTCFTLCKNIGNCQELKEKVTKIYDIFCLGDIDMKNINKEKGYVNYEDPFVRKGNKATTTSNNKIDDKDVDLTTLNNNTNTNTTIAQFAGIDAQGPYIGKCPKCGSTNIEANYGLVLTSMPPQYNCRCKDCNHGFFSSEINNGNETLTPNWVPYDPVEQPSTTPINPGYGYGNRQGWICPRCGKVNSPDRGFCDCSNNGGWSSPIVWCNTNNSSGNAPTTPYVTTITTTNIK